MTIVLFGLGIGLLIGGAELLVRGSSRLASAVGIAPLVIGLTVVAFGSGSPELAVSMRASFAGQSELALGNIIGSNMSNILLILGLSALVAPLTVEPQLVRFDLPLMIGVTALVWLLSLDGRLGQLDGGLLACGIVGYTVWSIWRSRRASAALKAEYAQEFSEPTPQQAQGRWYVLMGYVIAGLALLLVGAGWLVDGAVAFAEWLGVSQMVIGLTIVSIGTSLPEIAISVLASLRGERDIAVGNVVGSNLFNLLAVLGVSAALVPGGLPVPASAVSFDLPMLLVASLACLPIFWVGYKIARWEAVVFLLYYAIYTLYLLLRSNQHAELDMFSSTLLLFALPLTALTLMVRVVRTKILAARQDQVAATD